MMRERAVLCALGMQKAMEAVNEHNHQEGWPEIEMGIALHTGEVVVGNIGSDQAVQVRRRGPNDQHHGADRELHRGRPGHRLPDADPAALARDCSWVTRSRSTPRA